MFYACLRYRTSPNFPFSLPVLWLFSHLKYPVLSSKITADSAHTSPHLSPFLRLLSSAPTALTFPTFGVFVFSTNLRSGRISRTKHLKMKCWMKEWMVLNTTCSLNDNGEKFIGSQLKPKKNQNSWLQLDMGCFYFLATMNNAALNISVQFLWMGTLSWVYT